LRPTGTYWGGAGEQVDVMSENLNLTVPNREGRGSGRMGATFTRRRSRFRSCIYTDSSGAEYRLDQNTGGVWTSKDAIYISYEAATNKLWFNDGGFWLMNVESSGSEDDAGTLYPSLMQDSNGNQIKIRYKAGVMWGTANSSARIEEIEDVKAVSGASTYSTYSFTRVQISCLSNFCTLRTLNIARL
jgi:hypothetical protein